MKCPKCGKNHKTSKAKYKCYNIVSNRYIKYLIIAYKNNKELLFDIKNKKDFKFYPDMLEKYLKNVPLIDIEDVHKVINQYKDFANIL